MSHSIGVSKANARALIEQYFDSFNQGDFEKTASLFSQTGQLMPPFEDEITGPTEILSYLNKKAENMEAMPKQWSLYQEESDQWRVDVLGKVKAIVFQVNVNWQFTVTPSHEIGTAKIKLVASPKELLSLRSAKESATESAVATT